MRSFLLSIVAARFLPLGMPQGAQALSVWRNHPYHQFRLMWDKLRSLCLGIEAMNAVHQCNYFVLDIDTEGTGTKLPFPLQATAAFRNLS